MSWWHWLVIAFVGSFLASALGGLLPESLRVIVLFPVIYMLNAGFIMMLLTGTMAYLAFASDDQMSSERLRAKTQLRIWIGLVVLLAFADVIFGTSAYRVAGDTLIFPWKTVFSS